MQALAIDLFDEYAYDALCKRNLDLANVGALRLYGGASDLATELNFVSGVASSSPNWRVLSILLEEVVADVEDQVEEVRNHMENQFSRALVQFLESLQASPLYTLELKITMRLDSNTINNVAKRLGRIRNLMHIRLEINDSIRIVQYMEKLRHGWVLDRRSGWLSRDAQGIVLRTHDVAAQREVRTQQDLQRFLAAHRTPEQREQLRQLLTTQALNVVPTDEAQTTDA